MCELPGEFVMFAVLWGCCCKGVYMRVLYKGVFMRVWLMMMMRKIRQTRQVISGTWGVKGGARAVEMEVEGSVGSSRVGSRERR